MWVSRDFERLDDKFTPKKDLAADYFGQDGATKRLGRASMLRGLSSTQYARLKRADETMARGPYLPLIIEACGEEEFSYEYRHGADQPRRLHLQPGRHPEAGEDDHASRSSSARLETSLPSSATPRCRSILGPNAILQHKVPYTAG